MGDCHSFWVGYTWRNYYIIQSLRFFLLAGTMSKRSDKNKRNQPVEKLQPQNDNKEAIGTSTATIVAAFITTIGVIIVGAFTYLNNQAQVFGPIYVTQTAEAYYLTQTAQVPNSNTTLISTPTESIIPLPETNTPYPELSLNIIAPTKDNMNLVPVMYVRYEDIPVPDTRTYKVNVSSKVTYLWTYIWCAKHDGTLSENLNQIEFSFLIDDVQIPEDKFLIFKEPSIDGWPCQRWTTMLSGWDTSHFPTLSVVYNIPIPLSDGAFTYPIGEYRHQINVTILD